MTPVYSHLELQKLNVHKREEYRAFLERRFGKAGSFHLDMFYSQEFKPELITELFEGWTQVKSDVANIEYRYKSWRLRIYKIGTIQYVNYNREIYSILTMLPPTLDDFIRDCKRIKIELKWRENYNA